MRTLLITRPRQEAETLARALTAKGFTIFIEPMLVIEPMPDRTTLVQKLATPPAAMIITSRHALYQTATLTAERGVPLFCVGSHTAEQACQLGFKAVRSSRTVRELVSDIGRHFPEPQGIALLYLRGEDISTDIVSDLEIKGFEVESVTLYCARAVTEFTAPLQSALIEEKVHGALFFSRRTARTYVQLVLAYMLEAQHRNMRAVAMSDDVANALSALPWHSIRIAGQPDMNQMLATVETAF